MSSLIVFPSWRRSALVLKHHVALDHASSGNTSSDDVRSWSDLGYVLSGWTIPWLIIVVALLVWCLTWNRLLEKFHDRFEKQKVASDAKISALEAQNRSQKRAIICHKHIIEHIEDEENRLVDGVAQYIHDSTIKLEDLKSQIAALEAETPVNAQWTETQDSLQQRSTKPEPVRECNTDTQTEAFEATLKEEKDGNEIELAMQNRAKTRRNTSSSWKAFLDNNNLKEKTPSASTENANNVPSASKATTAKSRASHQEQQSTSPDQLCRSIIPYSPDPFTKRMAIGAAANDQRIEVKKQEIFIEDRPDQTALPPIPNPSTKNNKAMVGNSKSHNQEDGDREREIPIGDQRDHESDQPALPPLSIHSTKDSKAIVGDPGRHKQEDGDQEQNTTSENTRANRIFPRKLKEMVKKVVRIGKKREG